MNSATSGEESGKYSKLSISNQLFFFLPHFEDRETQSNLSAQSNEDEEEANISQEGEKKELTRNFRKTEAIHNFLEESLLQILRKKRTIQM